MSDVNANIGISINAAPALAELKNLQRQLANFHSQVAKGSAASAAAQKNLQTNLLNAINATGKFHAQMGLVRTSTESFTHALETNKLSMGQYFRYAGASTKTFGRMFKQEFDTIGKVAEERVKKMQTQYIKMGRDASGAMRAMAITPTSLNMKDVATQTALAAQKQALFNQLVKQGSTNLLNFGKNTQWAGRQLMVGFSIPLAYFGTAAAKTFMDLEAQAVRFKRVYGEMFTTGAETEKALQDIQKLAEGFTKYGVAVVDTMKMAADAAATGKMGSDLTAQVAEATRLSVLGQVEQQKALETTISLTNTFGIASNDLKKNIDFLNAVENQTVVNIEDLTTAIPKAGPVVKQLGGDVKDLAFFLTAMKEGGINASEGANALKSGLASMINPTKKAREMLAGMGIDINAIVEGNKGNLKEIVIDFAQALDKLDPLARSRAIEQLFGKFQFARLSTMFANITKEGTQANRVLDLTGKSVEELAILSERELKAVEDAVGTNFKEAVQQLKVAIAPIGKTFLEAVTPVLKGLGNLFEKFNNLGDGTKKFIVIMGTLVGLIGPVLLMSFGLLANGLANIVKLFLSLRTGFLRMTGDSKTLGATTNYLTKEQLEAETVAASLNQAHSRLTQQFEMETTAVMALRQAYLQATAAAAAFARANPGMMMPGKGAVPKKFNMGTKKVPGYKKGTDSVPAMLTPGEAVIPADVAQHPANKPMIQAMIDGNVAHYSIGTANAGEQYSHVGKSKYTKIDDILKQPGISELDKAKLQVYKDFLVANGYPPEVSTRHNLAFSFPGDMNARLASTGVPYAEFEKQWVNGGANKWISSNIAASEAKIVDDALIQKIRSLGVTTVTDDIIEQSFKELAADVKASSAYKKMEKLHNTIGEYTLGKGLSDSPEIMGNKIKTAIAAGKLGDYKVVYMSENDRLPTGETVKEALKNKTFTPPENQHTIITRKNGKQNSGIYIADKNGKVVAFGRGASGQRNPLKDSQTARRDAKTIAAKTGELIIDPKTGKVTKITEQNTKPKPAGVKTTTKVPADRRITRIARGQVVIPGADTGLDANGNPLPATKGGVKNIPFSSAAEQTRVKQSTIKQAEAIEENTKITKATTEATKTMGEKFTNGANIFAGLTIAATFLGGSIGDFAQKLVPFAILLSTLTMLGPSLKSGFLKLQTFLIANPWVAAIAALTTLVVAFKVLDDKAKKQAEAQSKYIDQVSATTEKMKKIGELTGKVGASEIMARRREGGTSNKFTTEYDRAGQQFGTNFLSSEVGKSIYDTFKTNLTKGGNDAVKQIALELSAYISDGLMSAEQANSVARSIGINMSDMTISANISGQLKEILGPNGEDLIKEPLKVRIKIIQEQAGSFQDILNQYKDPGLRSNSVARNLLAQVAASGTQMLEIIQAQRDAQSKLYDDQIRTLEAQLATTADKKKQKDIEDQIASLKTKQSQDDEKLASQRQKAIKDQIDAFRLTKTRGPVNREQTTFITSLNQQIKDKYKNDPLASVFLEKSKGTTSKILEVTLKTIVGAGDLTPNTANKLIDMFGKEGEQKLETLLTTTFAKKDPGKVEELINIATNIKGKGGKEIGLKLLTEIGAKGQENKFDDRLNALTLLQQMDGKEFNLALFLKGDGLAKIDKLVPLLNKVEKQKKIDIKVLQTLQKDPDMPSLKGLIDDWERYKNLPTELQKTVTQTYISVYKTITDKNVASIARAEAEKRGLRGRSASAFINKYGKDKDALAALLTREQFAAGQEPNTIPKGTGGGSSTGNRDTTLDNLLNRLKMVRDASINAQGGIKELQRITAGAGITKFSGMINQLMTGAGGETGQNRDFISFLESMDDSVRKTYVNTDKLKKGIVELTPKGQDLAEAFNEQTLGNFNTTQLDTITQIKAQQAAFIKLKAAGVDSATALNMVADAELAIAINSSVEPASKLKEMAIQAKAAKDAVTNLNLAFKQTMETSKAELETLKQLPSLIDQMKTLGMNSDQVQAVLNNPDFAREMLNNLKDGKIISADLVDYINSIPQRKQIEIDVAMKTPEGMQGLFDKAMANAEEYFRVLETAIQIKFKKPMKDAQAEVESAKKAVDDAQKSIDDIQATIDTKQRDIEINITRKIEEYQASIDALQEKITAQFDKPIAILAEESNKLSHDLGVMDHSAQAINEKYDTQQQALTKIADLNSQIAAQQKQQLTLADALTQGDISAAAAAAQEMRATEAANQINAEQGVLQAARDLEIANLRNDAGMTRAQIEERQYQIGQETYSLEQQRKVIEDQIAIIKETKIAPLDAKKVQAERDIRDLEDQIYGIQQGALKTAQDNLDKKQAALDKLQTQMNMELDAIDAERDRWVQAQNAIDLAKVKSDAYAESMKLNISLVEKLAAAWANVKPSSATTVIPGGSSGAGGNGSGNNSGANKPGAAWIPDGKGGWTKPPKPAGDYGWSDSKGWVKGYSNDDAALAAKEKADAEAKAKADADALAAKIKAEAEAKALAAADALRKLTSGQTLTAEEKALLGIGGSSGSSSSVARGVGGRGFLYESKGGFIPKYFASGGYSRGTDTVPAMLTPGEFVVNKVSAEKFGPLLSEINGPTFGSKLFNSQTPTPVLNSAAVNNNVSSVYNYSVGINVSGSNATSDDIARAVMTQIKYIDSQRIRGQK